MIGILLINLGTPKSPTENDVRNYLREFLLDPYVITLPKILREILVRGFILPKRPKISATAYQKIWTDQGSPLLVNSMALQKKLSEKLGEQYCVVLGMRYGNPSIQNAITQLKEKNCEKIIVLPLFPQFANATSQSAIDAVSRALKTENFSPEVNIIPEFYQENFYIDSVAKIIQDELQKNPSDFLLFSYHGLPQRQIDSKNNYQEKCFETTKLIAEKLKLNPEKFQTSFQSRLGAAKWIEPYTDHVLKNLREKNIKTLSVVCPSFVADCVETLEEINMRLREQWMQLGGEKFYLIPCLNAKENWITHFSAWLAMR